MLKYGEVATNYVEEEHYLHGRFSADEVGNEEHQNPHSESHKHKGCQTRILRVVQAHIGNVPVVERVSFLGKPKWFVTFTDRLANFLSIAIDPILSNKALKRLLLNSHSKSIDLKDIEGPYQTANDQRHDLISSKASAL